MKLLDVSKCHEDSPEFRSSLEKMEASVQEHGPRDCACVLLLCCRRGCCGWSGR